MYGYLLSTVELGFPAGAGFRVGMGVRFDKGFRAVDLPVVDLGFAQVCWAL
jgi:hypothetical protein